MRKNINNLGLLLLAMILFIGCEENEIPTIDIGEGFLQLSAESGSVTEDSADPIVTTVLLGNDGTNASGVSVSFTVTSSDNARFEVTPASGTVEIPAGEFSADIVVQPINNVLADGDVSIVIELSSSSALPVGLAGEGTVGVSRTITLIDDDCPVDSDIFTGTFDVEEVFTAGGNAGLTLAGAFGENYQIELTPDPTDLSGTRFIMSNSPGFNTYIADGTVLTLLTCSGTVGFSTGETINVALFSDITIESTSYSEAEGTIQVDGPLGNFGPYQFVLRKQ